MYEWDSVSETRDVLSQGVLSMCTADLPKTIDLVVVWSNSFWETWHPSDASPSFDFFRSLMHHQFMHCENTFAQFAHRGNFQVALGPRRAELLSSTTTIGADFLMLLVGDDDLGVVSSILRSAHPYRLSSDLSFKRRLLSPHRIGSNGPGPRPARGSLAEIFYL